MADPLGNFVPEFIENEVEREAIVKLAKMITDRVCLLYTSPSPRDTR